MKTESIIVSTDEFWSRMGDPAFFRVSLHKGRIGNTVIYTPDPPEKCEGFLESKMAETINLLTPKPVNKIYFVTVWITTSIILWLIFWSLS